MSGEKMAKEVRLIDANALKDEILSWAVCINKPHLLGRDETMCVIDNASTVDAVEVVHGRFVDAECSVCRWFGNIVETRHYNYCPNCGAKMDGERRTDNG